MQTDDSSVVELYFMALHDLVYSESVGAVYGQEAAVMLVGMGADKTWVNSVEETFRLLFLEYHHTGGDQSKLPRNMFC